MFFRTLPLLLLFAASNVSATSMSDSIPFPASWSGIWSGTLDIYHAKGKVQSIPMSLEILPIDTSTQGRYTFGMVYVSKDEDWRPYELVPVAPEKGLWQVDEKNSIVMESYLIGPKFLCWFVVQGARILCTYEKRGENEMIFEVCSGKETAVSSTGKGTHEGEEIPEVLTYPMSGFQRGVLFRK